MKLTDMPVDNSEPFRVCDRHGEIDTENVTVDFDSSVLKKMYRLMKLARLFDKRAVSLQRQGRLGTYAPARGQEASQIGSVLALKSSDLIFPSYRETPALLARGVPIQKILLYWGGDERGSKFDPETKVFPVSIPVGSQALHAVGAVRAKQIRDEPAFAIVYFGDGATSEGDLLEAMNFAAVWDTPVLFFCQNNQWAISVPRDKQTNSETLAQKSDAFGFDGLQIDGNDPMGVYQTVQSVREHCIEHSEPFFIEALTYRMGDHTTSDDAGRYRSEDELQEWAERDPLKRLKIVLKERNQLNETDVGELEEELNQTIKDAVEEYEQTPGMDYEDMFSYTFDEMPAELREQLYNSSGD